VAGATEAGIGGNSEPLAVTTLSTGQLDLVYNIIILLCACILCTYMYTFVHVQRAYYYSLTYAIYCTNEVQKRLFLPSYVLIL